MSDTVTIAVIATAAGVAGPAIMAVVASRVARSDRRERWKHDEALLEAQHENTEAVKAGNVIVAGVATVTSQTHALVNSSYTKSKQDELLQAKATLAALRMVRALTVDAGREPSAEDVETIHVTEARIVELAEIVADRLATQKVIDDKAAADLAAVELAKGAS